MRNWIWMLAILVALSFGSALLAQDDSKRAAGGDEAEGEAVEEEKTDYAALFKDAETVIDKITVSEDDIKSYLKHDASFTKAMKKDEKWNELKKKSLKEAHDHGIKSETFLAWAKENSVEASWLTKAMRIMCLTFPGLVDAKLEEVKAGRAELEATKADYSEEDFKAYTEMLDAVEKDMTAAKEATAKLPKATEAEAKLIEANKDAIVAAMFSGDDEEEPEEDDGGGEDDDMK